PAVDLHIHDTHFIGLIAGRPRGVYSAGVIANDVVEYVTTQYLYGPGGPALSCSSGAVAMSGRPFVHGFELYLEKATLVADSGGVRLLEQLALQGRPHLLDDGDYRLAHHLRRVAADAGRVFDDQAIVAEVAVDDADVDDEVGQQAALVLQPGGHLARQRQVQLD